MCHGHFPFFPIILRWLEKLAPARSDFFTTISCDNSSPMAHGWHITHSQGSRPPSCTRRRQSRPLFWKCWLVLQQRCPLQQPSDHDASRRHPGEGYDTYNVLLKTSLCVCVCFFVGGAVDTSHLRWKLRNEMERYNMFGPWSTESLV